MLDAQEVQELSDAWALVGEWERSLGSKVEPIPHGRALVPYVNTMIYDRTIPTYRVF